jgi:hypothetical protein
MALAFNFLTEGTDGTNKSASESYATASVSPTAGSMVLLLTDCRSLAGDLTVTGCNLTWEKVTDLVYDLASHLHIYKGTGTASTGAVTFVLADNATSGSHQLIEFTGHDTTTPIPQFAVNSGSGNTISATLSTFGAAANWTLLWSGWNRALSTLVVESGDWAAIGTEISGESMDNRGAYLDANDTSPTAAIAGGTPNWGCIALEIAEATAGGFIPFPRPRGLWGGAHPLSGGLA